MIWLMVFIIIFVISIFTMDIYMNHLGEDEDELFLKVKNILLIFVRCSYMSLKKEDASLWLLILSAIADFICIPVSIYFILVLFINYLFHWILNKTR